MNGCFSHCTARGLAMFAGLALAAASVSAESAAPGSIDRDGAKGTNDKSPAQLAGEFPSWMVDHPAALIQNGVPVGIDESRVTSQFVDGDAERDFLILGCQPLSPQSLFFLGDGALFGGQQLGPRKLSDNFVPGLNESGPGLGDGTPDGVTMKMNAYSFETYFILFVSNDGDGCDDANLFDADINPGVAGDQPYVKWTLRYFKETSGENNPTLPRDGNGYPTEIIAELDTGTNGSDFGGLTWQVECFRPGQVYDFYGFGPCRPAQIELFHSPIDVIAGDCYWMEVYCEYDEVVLTSTAQDQVNLHPGSASGDGWCWYNPGAIDTVNNGPGWYNPGDEQGPNGDRNFCLDLDEPGDDSGEPMPDGFINSGINTSSSALLPCTNDPCFGLVPFNDDCADAIEIDLDTPSPEAFSTTVCAIPGGDGIVRGGSMDFEEGMWFTIEGDGTTYTLDTCIDGNEGDEANMNGPRRNWVIQVFCGDSCSNLFQVGGSVLASDDVAGVGCAGPGSCGLDFNREGYSWPFLNFATQANQTYTIGVYSTFASGVCRVVVTSDGQAVGGDQSEQCDTCAFDQNFFGNVPNMIEAEDEFSQSAICLTYGDSPTDWINSRTNNACQNQPNDPVDVANYSPPVDFLNGADLTPIAGLQSYTIMGLSTWTTVDPGVDYPDEDHYAFTVAAPVYIRAAINGTQSTNCDFQEYTTAGITQADLIGACLTTQEYGDSINSTRCDDIPDNEASVFVPGSIYGIQANIQDGLDTGCNDPDRDYVLQIDFLSCPSVADGRLTADIVDNDLVNGILDSNNWDVDTDNDTIGDVAEFNGCNITVDYNSGCDRDTTQGELYFVEQLGMGDVFFGDVANDGNNTDTDWLEFTCPPSGSVNIDVDANFDFQLEIYEFPIPDCADLSVIVPSTVCNLVARFGLGVDSDGQGGCTSLPTVEIALTPGTNYGMRVAQGNLNIINGGGGVFDGRPCGVGYQNYTLSVTEFVPPTIDGCLGGFGGNYLTCTDQSKGDCESNGGIPQAAGNTCAVLAGTGCPADTTTSNTNPGDALSGVADGTVNGADLSFQIEQFLGGTPRGDVTTSNTNPGDAGFGDQDGVVNGADLSFAVERWIDGNGGGDCVVGN